MECEEGARSGWWQKDRKQRGRAKRPGDGEKEKKEKSDGAKTCRNLQREKQKPRLDVFLEVSSSLHLRQLLLLQPAPFS